MGAILSGIGIVIGVVIVAVLACVGIGKLIIDVIAYAVGKIRNAGK